MTNLDLYRQMHEAGHFPGHSTEKWSEVIDRLVKYHGAKTMLDFGSGKGEQYRRLKLHERWGVSITCYDPAVHGLNKLPNALQPFDGVICCDVLEHLEGDELDHAIFHASIRARMFCFFSVALFPAKKTLPDGRNAHITLESREWWFAKVQTSMFKHGGKVYIEFDEGPHATVLGDSTQQPKEVPR